MKKVAITLSISVVDTDNGVETDSATKRFPGDDPATVFAAAKAMVDAWDKEFTA